MAASALWECESFQSETEAKRNIVQAIKHVASRLGNTPAICRKCYVHPEVIAGYLDASLAEIRKAPIDQATGGLHPEEALVLAFLRQRAAQQHHELPKVS
jgi:DNA topoisomerase-1